VKLQKSQPLSAAYGREEDFTSDLAEHLAALGIGSFEDAETESRVGTRRADIVAVGDDGTLVVENQFGQADWDHWGRLEAYARLKEANVAALVAESFEELMIVTCNLRNEDSRTDWFLIRAIVNAHDELSFHHVARPAIDVKTERTGVEYSEFWEPIRRSGLFAGKPVPIRDEGWISKVVKGVGIDLQLHNHACSVVLWFKGEDRLKRRAQVVELLSDAEYAYEFHESPKHGKVIFPLLDKGRMDRNDWPVIRERLTTLGEDLYSRIKRSDI